MKNSRKILKIVLWICGIAVFLILIDAAIIISMGNIRPDCSPADAIIVLGSGHGNAAVERTLEGLALYETGKSSLMVLSGGKIDSSTTEAQFMKMVIEKHTEEYTGSSTLTDATGTSTVGTIPLPNIILEETSKNTRENLENSRSEIPDAKSIIIVTDTFHIARSVLSARVAGFAHICWASPNPSYIPKITLAEDYLREMVALPGYLLRYGLF